MGEKENKTSKKSHKSTAFLTIQWNWCALHHKCPEFISPLLCDSVIKSMLLHCWFPFQCRHEWAGDRAEFLTHYSKKIRIEFGHGLQAIQTICFTILFSMCFPFCSKKDPFPINYVSRWVVEEVHFSGKSDEQREEENGAQHKNFILWVSLFVCLEIGRFLSFIFYLQFESCTNSDTIVLQSTSTGWAPFFFSCVFVFSCVGRTTKDDPMSLNENNFLFVIYQNVHTTTQHWPDSERKDEIWREKIFFLSWRSVSCCQSFLLCCLHRRREIALISSMKSAEKKLLLTTNESDECEWMRKKREKNSNFKFPTIRLLSQQRRSPDSDNNTTIRSTFTDDNNYRRQFSWERDWWQVHAADDDDNSNDFLDLQINSVYFSPSISAVQCNSFNFFWR